MHNVLVLIPSARGIHPQTVSNLFNMRTTLERSGHRMHFGTLYRMPLDVARNELAAAAYYSKADLILLQDDDVQLGPLDSVYGITQMLKVIDAGASIVTAPCRLRSHDGVNRVQFNIFPLPGSEPEIMGETRVWKCLWTGLGSVLVHRRVFEKFFEVYTKNEPGKPWRSYASEVHQGKEAIDIFGSEVVPAHDYHEQSPPDAGLKLLDDRIFSRRARELGFEIHATIDVPTVHDSMHGCFAAEMEAIDRAKGDVTGAGLVNAAGRKL